MRRYGTTRVRPESNPQLKLYALGVVQASLRSRVPDSVVKLTIFQPRTSGASAETSSVLLREVVEWGDTVVRDTAQLAFHGQGAFNSGERYPHPPPPNTHTRRRIFSLLLLQLYLIQSVCGREQDSPHFFASAAASLLSAARIFYFVELRGSEPAPHYRCVSNPCSLWHLGRHTHTSSSRVTVHR
jgi:hypothetical protein